MTDQIVSLGDIRFSNEAPFVLLGGVNVLESRDFALQVARRYQQVCERQDQRRGCTVRRARESRRGCSAYLLQL